MIGGITLAGVPGGQRRVPSAPTSTAPTENAVADGGQHRDSSIASSSQRAIRVWAGGWTTAAPVEADEGDQPT